MAKLPKSIIKKYGISKKAWSVFRGTKTTKTRGTAMAKRRKSRGSFRAKARRVARRVGIGSSSSPFRMDAMLYGVARPTIANWITPFTNKIPLGNVSDEVALTMALWLGGRYLPNGMLRQVASKGIDIENYRVGEAIATGQIGIGSTSTGQTYVNMIG